MRIFLTCDDGFGEAGIEAMKEALKALSHRVTIVAPSSNNSGVSHGIHVGQGMEFTKVREGEYALNGTPADCVIVGKEGVMKDAPPDLIISGINWGANTSIDTIYSGTVAAARQGAIMGTPSIAVSLIVPIKQMLNPSLSPAVMKSLFAPLACFVANRLDEFMRLLLGAPTPSFLNINALSLPHPSDGEPLPSYSSFTLTHLGNRRYHNTVNFTDGLATVDYLSCDEDDDITNDYNTAKRLEVSISILPALSL